jgi:hypothetical protein
MIYKHTVTLGAAIMGIGLLFVLTNPERLPSAVFIVLFVLLYVLFYSSIALVGLLMRRGGLVEWSVRHIRQTALTLACLPVFLLLLQSIGQLTVRDVLLACGLFALLYLYFGRLFVQDPAKQ